MFDGLARCAVAAVFDRNVFGGGTDNLARKFGFVLDVAFRASALDAVERRLRDVDVAAFDQIAHLAEEERQQQRTDVRAVDIGIGHQDDLVIAQLRDIEVLDADAGSQGRDHGPDFLVAEHLVVARFLDVQDLAFEG